MNWKRAAVGVVLAPIWMPAVLLGAALYVGVMVPLLVIIHIVMAVEYVVTGEWPGF